MNAIIYRRWNTKSKQWDQKVIAVISTDSIFQRLRALVKNEVENKGGKFYQPWHTNTWFNWNLSKQELELTPVDFVGNIPQERRFYSDFLELLHNDEAVIRCIPFDLSI